MTDTSHQTNYGFSDILGFLYKERKPLIIITLVAAIASIIVSLVIENKFKSTVILFPASTSSISKALLSEVPQAKQDIMQFGEEEDAEQLLQILKSDEIRDRIIRKYNLMKHYKIDTASKYKLTKLFNKYKSNITFKKTEYMSVKIEVLDKDPRMASDIANDIANFVDTIKTRMQRERAVEALKIVENEYLGMQNYIKSLEDSMKKLMRLGIQAPEYQAEVLTQELAVAITKGNIPAAKVIQDKLDTIAKYGGAYISIRDYLEYLKKDLTSIKRRYDEAKIDATAIIPHKFVVNRAFPAEKKFYPIRWLIVVISTISAFLLAIIIFIIIDIIKKEDFWVKT